jgi:hypothetical protein
MNHHLTAELADDRTADLRHAATAAPGRGGQTGIAVHRSNRLTAATWHVRQRLLVEQSVVRSRRADKTTHRRWA